jgi:hypothetical protein
MLFFLTYKRKSSYAFESSSAETIKSPKIFLLQLICLQVRPSRMKCDIKLTF